MPLNWLLVAALPLPALCAAAGAPERSPACWARMPTESHVNAQVGNLLLLIGIILLAHAGYSTIQCAFVARASLPVTRYGNLSFAARPLVSTHAACLHHASAPPALLLNPPRVGPDMPRRSDRKYLRMIDQDYMGSPYDVHIECAVGCLLCLFGCVSCADDFEPIRLAQTFHRFCLALRRNNQVRVRASARAQR